MNTLDPFLVFMDLETTGLDYALDNILELGLVVVNRDLEVLASRAWVVQWPEIEYDSARNTYEPPFGIPKVVVDMHHNSGLWAESYRSTLSVHNVFAQASFWIGQQTFGKKVPLAGSTIHFDMSMVYMNEPSFLDLFHYRSVDCSSHRILYEEWVENSPSDRPLEPRPSGNDLHRTIPDCMDSINALRFYKRKLYDPHA